MTNNPELAPDMPSHKEYCEAAAKWLRGTKGCIIAAAEIVATTNERPDALGFKSHNSFMVEVKMSRADFMADKKKWHRQEPGRCIGDYRYYFCPPEVLFEHDMPAGWGLIWYDGKKCWQIVKAERMNDTNHRVERTFLISIIRRLKINCEYIKPKIAWPVHRRADLAPQGSVDVEELRKELRKISDQTENSGGWHFIDKIIDHLAPRLSPCPHKRIDHNQECLDCDEPVWVAASAAKEIGVE